MATTTVVSPGRTLEQRLAALEQANGIRIRRAELKRDLNSGARSVLSVLQEPPEWAESMRVRDVLRAQRGWGDVRTDRLLAQCGISPRKRLGALTPRQLRELVVRGNNGRRGGVR